MSDVLRKYNVSVPDVNGIIPDAPPAVARGLMDSLPHYSMFRDAMNNASVTGKPVSAPSKPGVDLSQFSSLQNYVPAIGELASIGSELYGQYQQNQDTLNSINNQLADFSSVNSNAAMLNLDPTGNVEFQDNRRSDAERFTGFLGGAAKGAMAGAALGPIGIGVGALIGGGADLVKGMMEDSGHRKAVDAANAVRNQNVNNFYNQVGVNDAMSKRNEMFNVFADGGDMQGLNGVNMFNTGGSHEENALNGIPQGYSNDGKQNLVEEGEVRFEFPDTGYIFSNRNALDASYLKNNNLPAKYAGRTPAYIAKKLQKDSEDRPNDAISLNTLNANMSRLRDAQEQYNQDERLKEFAESFQQMSPEQQQGILGLMSQSNGQEQQQFTYGGRLMRNGGYTDDYYCINNQWVHYNNLTTEQKNRVISYNKSHASNEPAPYRQYTFDQVKKHATPGTIIINKGGNRWVSQAKGIQRNVRLLSKAYDDAKAAYEQDRSPENKANLDIIEKTISDYDKKMNSKPQNSLDRQNYIRYRSTQFANVSKQYSSNGRSSNRTATNKRTSGEVDYETAIKTLNKLGYKPEQIELMSNEERDNIVNNNISPKDYGQSKTDKAMAAASANRTGTTTKTSTKSAGTTQAKSTSTSTNATSSSNENGSGLWYDNQGNVKGVEDIPHVEEQTKVNEGVGSALDETIDAPWYEQAGVARLPGSTTPHATGGLNDYYWESFIEDLLGNEKSGSQGGHSVSAGIGEYERDVTNEEFDEFTQALLDASNEQKKEYVDEYKRITGGEFKGKSYDDIIRVARNNKPGVGQLTPGKYKDRTLYYYQDENGDWHKTDSLDGFEEVPNSPVYYNKAPGSTKYTHKLVRRINPNAEQANNVELSNQVNGVESNDKSGVDVLPGNNQNGNVGTEQQPKEPEYDARFSPWSQAPMLAGLAGMAAGSMPVDYRYANELRGIAGDMDYVAAPHIGGYQRYNPVNQESSRNMVNANYAGLAALGVNRADRNAALAGLSALAPQQQAALYQNMANAEQMNQARRDNVARFNFGIDSANLGSDVQAMQTNAGIAQNRANLYARAAEAAESARDVRKQDFLGGVDSLAQSLGQYGKYQDNLLLSAAYMDALNENQKTSVLNSIFKSNFNKKQG